MNDTVIDIRSALAMLILGLLAVFISFGLPSATFASEVSVQTAQLLPPGGNTCTQPPISGFTPYVYGGALHSFELTVGDSSYVAIAGSAGDTNIPFNQMTRRIDPSGALRIHADMATTPIRGSFMVRVTMLSGKGAGEPVCISIVTATVGTEAGPQVAPTPPAPSPTPAAGTGTSKPRPGGEAAMTPPPSTGSGKTATGSKATGTPAATSKNVLKDICAAGGASRMWFILLAIYIFVVAVAVLGQPQMPPPLRTQEWTATAIVVPFLLLFGLWYFAESCRTSAWVPAIATVIALAGLLVAFWDRSTTSPRVINLPGSKT